MRRILLATVAALTLGAASPPPPAPLLLNAANLDPALLLPPAPLPDSAVGHAELEQLHHMDASRTPAEVERARADDAVKDVTIFAAAMGPGFALDRLPETQALFHIVRAEEKAAADRAKTHFLRSRPWIVDATLHPCSTADEPQSSYPSGHATMGYAMAAILAQLAPDKAPAILARAADYANARLVCEVHFRSDVAAGQAYGMMIAERLMEQPEFRRHFDAAAAELKAAELAG